MPLFFGPVIVWQRYAKSRVANPIHKPQSCIRGYSLAVVVFDEHVTGGYPPRLFQQNRWLLCVMQNVRKQHNIERCTIERNSVAVEHLNWNVGVTPA